LHSQIVIQDYSKTKEFYYFICSDIHFGNPGQNKKQLKADFDEAMNLGATIMINGDWGEFITSKDVKRYHPGGDKYNSDNAVNKTIDEAFTFFREYAKNIVFIGTGNHEVSVSKFHAFDPTQNLIFMLNKECGTDIQHGQYSGFITLRYQHGDNSRTRTKILYYNHGQGMTAEVTKGTIDINRHMSTKLCDIIWLGHKHQKLLLPAEPMMTVDKTGNIYAFDRTGIITGAYVNAFHQYDAREKGYNINYGEETKRTLQSTGGAIIKHSLVGGEVVQKVIM
jgi:hypothetical protein